jgi:adenine phosphoribosyltransferase
VWAIFRDNERTASPFAALGITKVAGVESRGFILGAPVAVQLRVGFVAIRKDGGLYPGPKVECSTEDPDYRGNIHGLRVQRASLHTGDRVLLVDDWIETGNQAATASSMIADCGAELVGVSVVVDQLTEHRRADFRVVHSVISASELEPGR